MRVNDEQPDIARRVASESGVPVPQYGNATLVRCEDVDAFLAACGDARVRVLGAEGFDLEDDGRRPDMQAIIDLSSLDDVSRTVEEARRIVAAICREGLWFEFDFADE